MDHDDCPNCQTTPEELMERFGVCPACARGESVDNPEACTCAPEIDR